MAEDAVFAAIYNAEIQEAEEDLNQVFNKLFGTKTTKLSGSKEWKAFP